MGTKDRKHNNSDGDALFRAAVGDATPLQSRERHSGKANKPRRAPADHSSKDTVMASALDTPADPAPVEAGEQLTFNRNADNRNIMRDLRRGKIPRQEEIDLHGLTSEEARSALRGFVSDCHNRRLRCISVVHGKGRGSGPAGPVLKNGINKWLRQWDEILAFCSAQNSDGGTGAVYVLLRNR